MFNNALSVSQYGTYIKKIFDAEVMLQGLSIFGEISGWQCVRDNAYFNLKDENACISCVFFGVGNNFFKDGDSVVVTGSPNYYFKGGKLNFNVHKIEKKGIGSLYENFLRLKQKLEKEGLFDQQIKKTIPTNIKKVGLVTSKTGAVLHDIMQVCERRNPTLQLILYPVKVQGEGADLSITKGINYFNDTDVDVVIVARGGGSQEDLSCFNTESVARAGFKLNKPLISAVGHETDFTIIDFVADVRAATPSVAGELVSVDMFEVMDTVENKFNKLKQKIKIEINNHFKILNYNSNYLKSIMFQLIEKEKGKINFNKQKIMSVMDNFYFQKLNQLSYNELKIEKLNPKQILNLGYAKIEQNGVGINNSVNLQDEPFDIYFKDDKIMAKRI